MPVIRLAQLDDAESIYLLNKNTLGYGMELEETKKRLEIVLERTTDKVWVAVLNGTVVGYVHAADYECTYMKSLKNILALAVFTEYQGQGFGKLLLEKVEEWSYNSGCSGVRFTSGYDRERAHEFYKHCQYIHRKNAKNFIKQFSQ